MYKHNLFSADKVLTALMKGNVNDYITKVENALVIPLLKGRKE